jgi:Aspartyl protease
MTQGLSTGPDSVDEEQNMRRLLMVISTVLTCLLLFFAAPAARAQIKTVQIPFSYSDGLIVIQAKINGKTAALLFDSGAMRTFVNPAVLDGLKTVSGNAISIADGNAVDVRVVKTTVSLGDASLPVLVSSYDMNRFAASIGLRIDGVIGQDVIAKFSGILIDYVRHRITLIE